MADDTNGPDDVTIEPAVRRIARLDPSSATDRHDHTVVRRSFTGVLGAERSEEQTPGPGGPASGDGPLGRSGQTSARPAGTPALSYLVLRPLVHHQIRERTERETQTETVERQTEEPTSDDADVGETTVRELLVERTEQRDAPDRPDESGSERPPLTELDSGGDGADRGSDGRVGHPGGGETRSGDATVTDRTGRTVDDTPETTLDASDDGSTDDAGESTAPGRDEPVTVRPDRPEASTNTDASVPGAAGDGPDLVLVDRSVAVSPDDGGGPTEPSSASRPPNRESATGQERPADGDAGGVPTRETGERATDESATTSGAESERGVERSQPRAAVPLDLSAVDRPALDRFVDQLSTQLSRRERRERERRGE